MQQQDIYERQKNATSMFPNHSNSSLMATFQPHSALSLPRGTQFFGLISTSSSRGEWNYTRVLIIGDVCYRNSNLAEFEIGLTGSSVPMTIATPSGPARIPRGI